MLNSARMRTGGPSALNTARSTRTLDEDAARMVAPTPRAAPFKEAARQLIDIMQRQWLQKHGVPLPAPTLTAQQRAEIEECFEMLDADGSGSIDVPEIVAAFSALGFNISKESIEDLMREADPDGSGALELDEFLSLMGRAVYHPEQNDKELVANTESGSMSFADAVRAFRRKKLIESLIVGGKARMKMVEFHERVQGLVAAEAAELRQRQQTHAIYERMETQRAERDRLSRVVLPQHQRTMKVKSRLQDAIGRSLGAFESLYRDLTAHKGLGLASTTACSSPDSLSDFSDPEPDAHPDSPHSTTRGTAGGGVTFLTEAHVAGAGAQANPGTSAGRWAAAGAAGAAASGGGAGGAKAPPALGKLDLLRGGDSKRGAQDSRHAQETSRSPGTQRPDNASQGGGFAWGPVPLSRSASMQSVDSTTLKVTKRVTAAVLRYFKQLEELAKQQERKYDDQARVNASFVSVPPDTSEFKQILQPSRPVSRIAQASAAVAAEGAAAAAARSPSPNSAGAHPHLWGVPPPSAGGANTRGGSGRGDCGSGQGSRGPTPAGHSPSPGAASAAGGGGCGWIPHLPPTNRRSFELPSDRLARAGTASTAPMLPHTGPALGVPAPWPDPRSSSPLPGANPRTARRAPSPGPALSATPSRGWRQAPSFGAGPAHGGPAFAFGWGSGLLPGAGLRPTSLSPANTPLGPAGGRPRSRVGAPWGLGAPAPVADGWVSLPGAGNSGPGEAGGSGSGSATGNGMSAPPDPRSNWFGPGPGAGSEAGEEDAARAGTPDGPWRATAGAGLGARPFPPRAATSLSLMREPAPTQEPSPLPPQQPPTASGPGVSEAEEPAAEDGGATPQRQSPPGSPRSPRLHPSHRSHHSRPGSPPEGEERPPQRSASPHGPVTGTPEPAGPFSRAWVETGRSVAQVVGVPLPGPGSPPSPSTQHSRLDSPPRPHDDSSSPTPSTPPRLPPAPQPSHGTSHGSSMAAGAAVAAIPAPDSVRAGAGAHSFSHGPFRPVSRAGTPLHGAVGPIAAAMLEGVVSVGAAPVKAASLLPGAQAWASSGGAGGSGGGGSPLASHRRGAKSVAAWEPPAEDWATPLEASVARASGAKAHQAPGRVGKEADADDTSLSAESAAAASGSAGAAPVPAPHTVASTDAAAPDSPAEPATQPAPAAEARAAEARAAEARAAEAGPSQAPPPPGPVLEALPGAPSGPKHQDQDQDGGGEGGGEGGLDMDAILADAEVANAELTATGEGLDAGGGGAVADAAPAAGGAGSVGVGAGDTGAREQHPGAEKETSAAAATGEALGGLAAEVSAAEAAPDGAAEAAPAGTAAAGDTARSLTSLPSISQSTASPGRTPESSKPSSYSPRSLLALMSPDAFVANPNEAPPKPAAPPAPAVPPSRTTARSRAASGATSRPGQGPGQGAAQGAKPRSTAPGAVGSGLGPRSGRASPNVSAPPSRPPSSPLPPPGPIPCLPFRVSSPAPRGAYMSLGLQRAAAAAAAASAGSASFNAPPAGAASGGSFTAGAGALTPTMLASPGSFTRSGPSASGPSAPHLAAMAPRPVSPQLPSSRSSRVVVTFMGQEVPRSSEGALLLPPSPTAAAAAAAVGAGWGPAAALSPSHTRPHSREAAHHGVTGAPGLRTPSHTALHAPHAHPHAVGAQGHPHVSFQGRPASGGASSGPTCPSSPDLSTGGGGASAGGAVAMALPRPGSGGAAAAMTGASGGAVDSGAGAGAQLQAVGLRESRGPPSEAVLQAVRAGSLGPWEAAGVEGGSRPGSNAGL